MLTIRGRSDDGLCFDGDIEEEYDCYNAGEMYVTTDKGHAFTVNYDGIWKIIDQRLLGDTKYLHSATDPDEKEYSDVVQIDATIEWVKIEKVKTDEVVFERNTGKRWHVIKASRSYNGRAYSGNSSGGLALEFDTESDAKLAAKLMSYINPVGWKVYDSEK